MGQAGRTGELNRPSSEIEIQRNQAERLCIKSTSSHPVSEPEAVATGFTLRARDRELTVFAA